MPEVALVTAEVAPATAFVAGEVKLETAPAAAEVAAPDTVDSMVVEGILTPSVTAACALFISGIARKFILIYLKNSTDSRGRTRCYASN